MGSMESTRIPAGRYVLFAAVALGGATFDLATKAWAFDSLGVPSRYGASEPALEVWPGVFHLHTSLNQGAVFGVGQGFTSFFAVLSVLILVGIVYWLFVHGAARDRRLATALAFIAAGTLGNLYDRLHLHGLAYPNGDPAYGVRDFLYAVVIDWPIFNFADVFLTIGAALLLLGAIVSGLREPRTATQGGGRGEVGGGSCATKAAGIERTPADVASQSRASA